MPARPARPLSWPFALLLLSLAVMVTTAVVAWQGARRHRETAEQLLRDYARFAAWNYARYLGESLGEMNWLVVNPVLHRQVHQSVRMPDAADLVGYHARSLGDCHCDPGYRAATYFRFARHQPGGLLLAGDTTAPAAVAALRADLEARLDESPFPRAGVYHLAGLAPRLVGYGLMPTARGDTMVYGVVVDPASHAAGFRRALAQGPLLPEAVTGGRPNAELVALEVRAGDGASLYRDSTWAEAGPVAEEHLRLAQGGLVVRATIRPSAAPTLLAGGLPNRGGPLLLVAAALATGLALVALLQLRREDQLARMRGDFVASVSHDLRTPLAQLRLYLDTLRLGRYATTAQRDWILSHLARETTRLEQLVESVLAFSRLEHAAPADGPAAPLSLAAEVEDAVALLRPLAEGREVRVELTLDPALHAAIDAPAFRQVVLNLLDNALKFGPRGQRVRVSLVPAGPRARLTVADEGPGVAPQERERIWEPYFRGGSEAARTAGGSGIGLALVAEAVRRAGGTVSVTDGGPGAVFTVELLVVPAVATAPAAVTSSTEPVP